MLSRSRSFKAAHHIPQSRQRGDVLLEALIGTLLMGIVGLGLVYSASKVEVSHSQANAGNLAISQMRSLLQRYGPSLCDVEASKAVVLLPPNETNVALDVQCSNTTVTVQGVAIANPPKAVVLATPPSANNYFGGVLKVGE